MSSEKKKKKDTESHDETLIVTQKILLNDPGSTYEPFLMQLNGRETGKMYAVTDRSLKLGRDPSCQISLNDPHISRFHAEILKRDNGEVCIRDIGSTNGVFVNGKRVTEQVLMESDKIVIGTRMQFKFCYQDAVVETYQQNIYRTANIDSLTQLYNKNYFIDIFSKEFSFSRRNNQPLSLMMIDIDHFKSINDTHGHMAGDMVLKSIGQYLLKHLRMENIACRFGGEEFAVILRNVTGDMAYTIAERLRTEIEAGQIAYLDKNISTTISIGIATLEGGNFETIEDFIQKADQNLYRAKEAGRNRTVQNQAA